MPEVRVRQLRFGVALLGATLAGVILGGCSADLSQLSATDLNPFKGNDPFRASDYNYFYRGDASTSGPVTAADLVGPDGRCAFAPAPAPMMAPGAPAPDAPVAAPATDPINPQSNGALYFTAGPQSGQPAGAMPPEVRNGPRGISLAMTECQVMSVAGYTDRVEIGTNTRGERTATLTYMSGERPGIYHFRGGRLMSMERVAEPAAPKKPARPVKTAKVTKKPTKKTDPAQ